jgi:putative transposase
MKNPFRYFNSSPEIIRLAVMMYIRYPLSLRQVEDNLFERGIDICHETVLFWWNRFGPMFADEIRKRRKYHCSYSNWRWHLDEVFVRINGETQYLWRAVDHEGEVLEVFATKRRDRKAALKFLRRAMKRYGRPKVIVTDRLRSYRAALNVIGNVAEQECGRWINNRAENSHQPFRRREGAMSKFRTVKTLQKFASTHASIHNHFNCERHLNRRDIFKQDRAAALTEWRQLAA